MKNNYALVLLITFINFAAFSSAKARQTQLSQKQTKEIKAVSTKNFESFRLSIKPLIKEMSINKIVGLGEGTHGTAQFYTYRFYITRILIEEYGFNHIAFENDATEVWQLNKELANTSDVGVLMKKYLLTLWQNEETKAFLTWIKFYNSKHTEKIIIDGIDYPAQLPDVLMIEELLAKANNFNFNVALMTVGKAAKLQDDAWRGMNKKDYKSDWKTLRECVRRAYSTADSMEIAFKKLRANKEIKGGLLLAISNLKQGFEPFYIKTSGTARDSIMAYNTAQLIKSEDDKVVIWAHNAHLGKVGIYNNVVGGTGGYLRKLFPKEYYVMGTGTANGTFGATTDARVVNDSPILSHNLEPPIKDSWEAILSVAPYQHFYFRTAPFNSDKQIKPLRFIGYGMESGESSYDSTNLSDIFDSFLFLRNTSAPTPLK